MIPDNKTVPTTKDYCPVPILEKVLVPAPGYETRLYSVQLLSMADAEDYYHSMEGRWKKEEVRQEKEVGGMCDRERSPVREGRRCAEYWNTLGSKDCRHYKA